MKQIKLAIGDTECDEFYIEICSTEMATTAYHQSERLYGCKKATGYGYNKESTSLANALNCLTGESLAASMNSGVASVIEQAAKHGIRIEGITTTKSGRLYKFTNFNPKMTNLEGV